MARRSVAAALAFALALPVPAAAHPFAPRSLLSVSPGSSAPAPETSSPGPWTPGAAATAGDPALAPAPAASPPASDAAASSDTLLAAPPTELAPAPAPAAPALLSHPTFIRPAIDFPVIALGAAIFLGTEYATKEQKWPGCGACDGSHLGPLDRRVLGNADKTAARASDVLLASAIALPFLLDLGDALAGSRRRPGGTRHAAGGWARDAVVLAEVFAVNLGLTNIVKFAVRRPRPYSYDADSELADPTENDARLSFYSGHASNAFAMLTAYAMLFTFRHPRARAAVPVWIAALGLAATTGVLRVVAGKHFWSDVVTGAFAGAAVGVLVPALHNTRWRRLTPGLSYTPKGALVSLAGRF